MAEKSKIDKYHLEDRVVGLYREGKTTGEIAEIISSGLQASGIDDGVDQSTVSRWLKKVRAADEKAEAEREREALAVVRARVKDGIENDLEQIAYVQTFLFQIVEGTLADAEGNLLRHNVKERKAAGVDLVKLIDTKLRLPGVGDDGSGNDESAIPAGSNVHSLLDRLKKTVEGGTGLRATGTEPQ